MSRVPSGFSLLLTNTARKELAKIKKGNPKNAAVIASLLSQLQEDPHLGEPLHGDLKGRFKIRIGDYRIIYRFNKTELIIIVLRIAHRKDVYQ